jgi:hypothetical protein
MPEKPFEDKFRDMCFATYLLSEIEPNPKYVPSTRTKCYTLILISRASRLYTRVVLIDFHQAEDRGTKSGEQATDRNGQ